MNANRSQKTTASENWVVALIIVLLVIVIYKFQCIGL